MGGGTESRRVRAVFSAAGQSADDGPNGEIEGGLTAVMYSHRRIAGGARMAPFSPAKCLFVFLLAGQLRIVGDLAPRIWAVGNV